jgi:hypothetical protein
LVLRPPCSEKMCSSDNAVAMILISLPGGGENLTSQAMPPPSRRRSLNTLSCTISLPSWTAAGPKNGTPEIQSIVV